MPQIKHLTANECMDILYVHGISLQIANWGGLGEIEQIRFAASIAEYISNFNNNAGISFWIEENNTGQHLRVLDGNDLLITEKRLPQKIIAGNFEQSIQAAGLRKESLEKNHLDMQQFVFALTHDLKNSQTKLKLALALLETEEIPNAIFSYVHLIHKAADRLESTMLSVNKIIELGHDSADVIKKISLPHFFDDLKEEFSDTLAAANASVTISFAGVTDILYIEAYLKSIFANLLGNSIKYAVKARALEIAVRANRKNDKIFFTFSDNGRGIDLQKFSDKLFQPFTRFDTTVEGSGNGLYLIKNMIERNGGKIEVESLPGHGTTFSFVLQEYNNPSEFI